MAPSGPPASKAAAKADAAPKAKAPKKEKKVDAEDAKPHMPAPDFDAYQEKVAKVQAVIDDLQKQSAKLTDEMKGRSSGKEDFFSKKAIIRAELDEVSGKMNALQEQKESINKALGDRTAESAEMKSAVNKMKKSIGFTSEADIDDRIRSIEYKMQHESLSLKDEKAYMLEIKELKKNKPKVSQVSQMENKLQDFKNDSGLSLKEQRNEINGQMAGFRDVKKEIQERLAALQEERKTQLGDMPEILEKKDALQKKIQEKIVERTTLREDFNTAKKAFQEYLAEQRKVKQERYQEEQKARQAEYKIRQMEKKVEALDEQPFVAEIVLIEQTVKFCKGLVGEKEEEKKEELKDTVFNNKEGETVLASKKDRDQEMYYAATKKGKAAKKQTKPEGDVSKKPIKHNAETFKLFDSLKLDAPITTADVPALLVKLDAQMEMYKQKVKDWEQNREEMKAKILAGIPDEEPEKEEAKEEEKEEEKEE